MRFYREKKTSRDWGTWDTLSNKGRSIGLETAVMSLSREGWLQWWGYREGDYILS